MRNFCLMCKWETCRCVLVQCIGISVEVKLIERMLRRLCNSLRSLLRLLQIRMQSLSLR